MHRLLNEIKGDLLSPSILLSSFVQGVIIGTMLVIIESSFASMVFSGSLSEYSVRASGLLIFSGAIMTLVSGGASSFKGVVAVPQDMPAAILAGVVATLAVTLSRLSLDVQFATVVSLMMLTGLVTAFCFFLIGKLHLSNLVRFLPFPVIGGFLAGCGLLLCLGGLSVMTGVSPSLESLSVYSQGDVLGKWSLGVGFALIIFFVLKLRPHVLVLPTALVLGIGAFFMGLHLLGIDSESARRGGWLLGALPSGGLCPVLSPRDLWGADWMIVLSCLPDILSVAMLAAVALMLNMGGIELGAQTEIDMDRELLTGGATNFLGGLAGGFSGYASVSLSLLSHRTGVSSRLVSLFAGLVCLFVVFVGADVLTYFPKPILGSLLFLLGLFFFDDWIFSGWKKITAIDFCVVLGIVATVGCVGFLEGVGLGLLLTTFFFVFRFSRVSVIGQELTGADVSSQVERPVAARVLLGMHADDIKVFMLNGYIFFGSANFLVKRIGTLLKLKTPPRFILLDMKDIDGFDISAVNNFQRLAQQAQNANVKLLLSCVPDRLWELFVRNAHPDVLADVRRYTHLSLALEYCESEILELETKALSQSDGGDHLFNLAYDELDSHLKGMERFEAVLEGIQGLAREVSVSQGEPIVTTGQRLEGAFLVVWGTVGEYFEQDGQEVRLRLVGRGNVLVPQGVLPERIAPITARAHEDCVLAFIPQKAMERFSKQSPEQALALHELLLSMATSAY